MWQLHRDLTTHSGSSLDNEIIAGFGFEIHICLCAKTRGLCLTYKGVSKLVLRLSLSRLVGGCSAWLLALVCMHPPVSAVHLPLHRAMTAVIVLLTSTLIQGSVGLINKLISFYWWVCFFDCTNGLFVTVDGLLSRGLSLLYKFSQQ